MLESEFSSLIPQRKKEGVVGRANFNDVTESYGKVTFLDRIFCKECKMPVAAKDLACGKCDHEFPFRDMVKAVATQAKLRDENQRNKKYVPPELYI
jgi:hypothetical protein